MLSRKLPPGAAQAVDLASDPGPAQPSNRPVAYSREHLQLLPQTELVNLVLMWQSFHRMLPAPPHAVLQARAGPLGGQQPAQAPDAGTQHVEPQIQLPPFAAAQMKGLAPGAAYIGGVGGVKRGLNGVPAAADGRPRKRSDSGARSTVVALVGSVVSAVFPSSFSGAVEAFRWISTAVAQGDKYDIV